jgi:hypothetical protein
MARITHLLRLALRQSAALAVGTSILLLTPLTALGAWPPPSTWTVGNWKIEELKPNIKQGGRGNSIAVHPNDSTLLVASESGGLFRSDDGGNKWQHVDSLPVFYTNVVAFVSGEPKIVIVTAMEDFSVSNRGGIWRSEDGGASWKQVLWKDTTSGQIDDGTLPPNPSWPCGPGQRFSAYEISVASDSGKIYVADSCGVSISSDQGKAWIHVNVFGGGDRRIMSVLALPITAQGCDGHQGGKNLVLAGGPAGVRRSPDGGTNWCEPTSSNPAAIKDMHAFGRSPIGKNHAYVVAEAELTKSQRQPDNLSCDSGSESPCTYMILYWTDDGGDIWHQSYIAHYNDHKPRDNIDGCGGIAFVKAIGDATSFNVYVSNRCAIFKQTFGWAWDLLVGWPQNVAGDTRDIAFGTNNKPILAASDNGLIQPPVSREVPSTEWTFAGADNQGNIPNGYNALQIYEVKGQWIDDIARHQLYFGTQDNAVWSSTDGETWTRCCNEGEFFEGEYHVATSSDSQITFHPHYDHSAWKLKAPLFTCPSDQDNSKCDSGIEPWQSPKLEGQNCRADDAPKIITKNFHVQGVEWVLNYKPDPHGLVLPSFFCARGLAVTYNLGEEWYQYATFGEDRFDLPKLSRGMTPAGPKPAKLPRRVLYQAIRSLDPNNMHHLARIVGEPCPNPSPRACVTYPYMKTCNTCPATNTCTDVFGELGKGPTMRDSYRVFAVDPGKGKHLIAPDLKNEKMMETWDGGDCWTENTDLTKLVKDGGNLKFSGSVFFNGYWGWPDISQASAISLNPDYPDMVAVGTVQNGILISSDRGKTWTKVPGSDRATLISSLHWRTANEIIISTYGRGLWRVSFSVWTVGDKDLRTDLKVWLSHLCDPSKPESLPPCFILPPHPVDQPIPFDQAVFAIGGRIEGARVANGILQELFIRPGTSIAFVLDSDKVPDLKLTETTRPVGFVGVKAVPRNPKGAPIITGLMLRNSRRNSELIGFVFAPTLLLMYAAEAKDLDAEKPVGQEVSPNAGKPYLEVQTPATGSGGAIPLAGRNHEVGSTIEIAIDGRTVEKVVVGQEGRFFTTVQAPSQFGLHRITIIDGASRKVLDEATVTVRPDR